jgi:uncharacterized protein with PQ loop repeat
MLEIILRILDYGVLVAFFATSIDTLIQIKHVYKRKSSKDLSMLGCFIRLFAALIFTVKFYSTGDIYLIVGQTIFSTVYIIYFFMLLYYRR